MDSILENHPKSDGGKNEIDGRMDTMRKKLVQKFI